MVDNLIRWYRVLSYGRPSVLYKVVDGEEFKEKKHRKEYFKRNAIDYDSRIKYDILKFITAVSLAIEMT